MAGPGRFWDVFLPLVAAVDLVGADSAVLPGPRPPGSPLTRWPASGRTGEAYAKLATLQPRVRRGDLEERPGCWFHISPPLGRVRADRGPGRAPSAPLPPLGSSVERPHVLYGGGPSLFLPQPLPRTGRRETLGTDLSRAGSVWSPSPDSGPEQDSCVPRPSASW